MTSDIQRQWIATNVDFMLVVLAWKGKCWLVKGENYGVPGG